MTQHMGFVNTYGTVEGYEEFRYPCGRPGSGRVVSVTRMVALALRCKTVERLSPSQVRNTIRASGRQFGYVQIGRTIFKMVEGEWSVLC